MEEIKKTIARTIAGEIKEFFSDPENQKLFEEWKNEKERKNEAV